VAYEEHMAESRMIVLDYPEYLDDDGNSSPKTSRFTIAKAGLNMSEAIVNSVKLKYDAAYEEHMRES
jgi:hypothetical protein